MQLPICPRKGVHREYVATACPAVAFADWKGKASPSILPLMGREAQLVHSFLLQTELLCQEMATARGTWTHKAS